MSGWNTWNTWHALPRDAFIAEWDFAQAAGTQEIPSILGGPSLFNGSDPANADASDITFDGTKGVTASKYALTNALANINMAGDWTMLMVGVFSAAGGAPISWGLSTGAGDWQMLSYGDGVAGRVKFWSTKATVSLVTGTLNLLPAAPCCIIIRSSGGQIHIKRMDTGSVSTSIANNGPATTSVRIGVGCKITNAVGSIVASGDVHYVALRQRAWTDAEAQAAWQYVRTQMMRKPHDLVWPEPMVSWEVDDAPVSTYTVTYPVLASYGIRGVANVVTSYPGDAPGINMSWGQIQELQAAGWEICSHSHEHANLTTLTEAQLRSDFTASQAAFAAHGIRCNNIAYPGGVNNATVRAVAAEFYRSGRDVYATDGIIPYNVRSAPYAIQAIGLDNFRDAGDLALRKGDVDTAATNAKWIRFFQHNIDGTYEASMRELIDYINAKGVFRWVTPNEALDSLRVSAGPTSLAA